MTFVPIPLDAADLLPQQRGMAGGGVDTLSIDQAVAQGPPVHHNVLGADRIGSDRIGLECLKNRELLSAPVCTGVARTGGRWMERPTAGEAAALTRAATRPRSSLWPRRGPSAGCPILPASPRASRSFVLAASRLRALHLDPLVDHRPHKPAARRTKNDQTNPLSPAPSSIERLAKIIQAEWRN